MNSNGGMYFFYERDIHSNPIRTVICPKCSKHNARGKPKATCSRYYREQKDPYNSKVQATLLHQSNPFPAMMNTSMMYCTKNKS